MQTKLNREIGESYFADNEQSNGIIRVDPDITEKMDLTPGEKIVIVYGEKSVSASVWRKDREDHGDDTVRVNKVVMNALDAEPGDEVVIK